MINFRLIRSQMEQGKNEAEKAAIHKLRRKNLLQPADYYVEGILRSNRTILGQAITLVESSVPEHQTLAAEILRKCIPFSGNSIRIGITGVPGVGKSTFIEALGVKAIEENKKPAILAIDPSSPISKGSILGDKTRMESLSMSDRAFIRPSPSASSLGGVARKTHETIFLCEASGFDFIIIETVGVGQSEIAVHQMTDFFLLLMLAGAGDQLQGIKRGIMEMCDALLITKADGENKNAATRAKGEYQSALHFYPPKENAWIPPVDLCSALTGEGIDRAWKIIQEFDNWQTTRGFKISQRNRQNIEWMHLTLKERLVENFFARQNVSEALMKYTKMLESNAISPFEAAEMLLNEYSI